MNFVFSIECWILSSYRTWSVQHDETMKDTSAYAKSSSNKHNTLLRKSYSYPKLSKHIKSSIFNLSVITQKNVWLCINPHFIFLHLLCRCFCNKCWISLLALSKDSFAVHISFLILAHTSFLILAHNCFLISPFIILYG